MTNAKPKEICSEWDQSGAYGLKDGCLPELIEEQAARAPEAVAVVLGNQQLSYGELNAKSNQLARHLRKLGVGPDTLVGICVERSLEMVIGLLGILKAGGAYVPLDPEYPKERLAFMLEDSAVTLLLTQAHLVESIPASAARVVRLDADWPTITHERSAKLEPLARPENLAYIIYTSGSTGRPKGVMVTHENVMRLFTATQPWYQFNEQDVWTLFHSFAFDFSVWEIWGALLYGGRLVIVPYLLSRSPDEFYLLLAREQVTVLNQTPSAFRQLIQAEEDSRPSLKLALRQVIFGGEALEMQSLRPWFERHGDQQPRLVNMYGITETTVHVTYRPIDAADLNSGSVIGVPIPDLEIHLLDENRQPVPVGVVGEIYVGGAGVARGYLNRTELTAERFIANPFGNAPGARLYKSGDLARWLPNGDIEYLGRADDQVKIRGHRIELGEIESTLARHPGISACAAIAREDTPGDKRLAAYIVSRNGTISSSELREYLQGKLPDYMMPAAFVPLEVLPLTLNGKLDRKALPKPDFEASVDKDNFVAPFTPTEKTLAGFWGDILGLKQVGIRDSFFDLGGNSVLTVRLINKINKSLTVELSVLEFFQNSTIQKLATIIDQQDYANHRPASVADQESVSPVIPFQRKGDRTPLYFFHGDWAGGGLYCGPLSQQIGEDQPFYALPPYHSKTQTTITLEEMVAYQIAIIRKHRPHGPYLLGGYCAGALVAMEIARQLIREGEEVPHLFLLDPPLRISPALHGLWAFFDQAGAVLKWDLQKRIRYFDRFPVALVRWLELSPRGKVIKICQRLGLTNSADATAITMGLEDGEYDVEILESLEYAVYFLATCLYQLKPLSVPIALYLPEETDRNFTMIKCATQNFPILSIENVPGNHHTCITKHASELSKKIKKTLGSLEAAHA
jgi:amino acid adenylation domain-containing protein